MRITVTVDVNATTKKEYGFNVFDFNVVFVTYHKEEKPKGKGKWQIVEFWDQYSRQSTVKEPTLPDEIIDLATTKVFQRVRVMTWEEWKSKS